MNLKDISCTPFFFFFLKCLLSPQNITAGKFKLSMKKYPSVLWKESQEQEVVYSCNKQIVSARSL